MAGKTLCSALHSGTHLRENDRYLMDVWDSEVLSISNLQILNYYRLYIKVNCLSEIVTNDGLHTQERYPNVQHINCINTHDWPRQENRAIGHEKCGDII